jgi:nucleoside-diphosphate-sugar epimerase
MQSFQTSCNQEVSLSINYRCQNLTAILAFDSAVVSDPPFEAVIHAASPYHFKADTQEAIDQLIDTAVNGTIGILKAVKSKAPSVRRMVVTSSFAAIVDPGKPVTHQYSEKDWDPVTREQASEGPLTAYRASKTLAERSAWDFVEKEKPNFTLSTVSFPCPFPPHLLTHMQCNPPLVLGPIVHYLNSLENINTSNQRIRDLMTGASKEKLGPSGNHLWVDVRDIALAHVLAVEKPEAAGKRFFITNGNFCNREIRDIIEEEFPEYKDRLPTGDAVKPGDYPAAGVHGWDNTQSKEVLGLEYRPFKQCIIDTVKSLQPLLKD